MDIDYTYIYRFKYCNYYIKLYQFILYITEMFHNIRSINIHKLSNIFEIITLKIHIFSLLNLFLTQYLAIYNKYIFSSRYDLLKNK
jgi:hypothetical protein